MIQFFLEMQDYSLFTISGTGCRLKWSSFHESVGLLILNYFPSRLPMAPILKACRHTDFLPAPLLTYFVGLAPNTDCSGPRSARVRSDGVGYGTGRASTPAGRDRDPARRWRGCP